MRSSVGRIVPVLVGGLLALSGCAGRQGPQADVVPMAAGLVGG